MESDEDPAQSSQLLASWLFSRCLHEAVMLIEVHKFFEDGLKVAPTLIG